MGRRTPGHKGGLGPGCRNEKRGCRRRRGRMKRERIKEKSGENSRELNGNEDGGRK